jgi:hypothetical protein
VGIRDSDLPTELDIRFRHTYGSEMWDVLRFGERELEVRRSEIIGGSPCIMKLHGYSKDACSEKGAISMVSGWEF